MQLQFNLQLHEQMQKQADTEPETVTLQSGMLLQGVAASRRCHVAVCVHLDSKVKFINIQSSIQPFSWCWSWFQSQCKSQSQFHSVMSESISISDSMSMSQSQFQCQPQSQFQSQSFNRPFKQPLDRCINN